MIKHWGTNERPSAFWALLGPMFASAKVHRELTTLHDNPESDEWFVSVADDGSIVGFACLRISGGTAELCHCWVADESRRNGVSKLLTSERLKRAKAIGLESVFSIAAPARQPELVKQGFVAGKSRGKFVRMEKALKS